MLVKIPIIQTLYGIRSMRQTIKDIEVNVAYRWFLGLKLEDKVPHFSTYGKNYVRRFQDKQLIEEIFKHILQQCIFAGYVDASELFVDGTHIKAAANKGTSKNQLSSIISKKEETLALQFPARVPVFPTFLSLLSGEF